MCKSNFQLHKLLLYRNLINDKIINNTMDLIYFLEKKEENPKDSIQGKYYTVCAELLAIAEEKKYQGNLWSNYLLESILNAENVFTINSEKYGSNIGTDLKKAAVHDLIILKKLFYFNLETIGQTIGGNIDFLNNYSPTIDETEKPPYFKEFKNLRSLFTKKQNKVNKEIIDKVINYYNTYGAGVMGNYTTFRWNQGKLLGIKDPDPVKFEDLIGYEEQKKQLIANTRAFICNKRANNVLLFGDSGTGKSSSIKALSNKFSKDGLRLIEIDKNDIRDLPRILQLLKERGLYFIIFMDDLSFSDFETGYKYLKALMEGGVEVKPENVLFYATSNRRHIIKEKWSDRNGENSEIHLNDAVQEKFSLSERFGLTINYQAPPKKEFIDMVKKLARRNDIKMSEDILVDESLKWEKRYNSMSGRSAQQFINYLLGEKFE